MKYRVTPFNIFASILIINVIRIATSIEISPPKHNHDPMEVKTWLIGYVIVGAIFLLIDLLLQFILKSKRYYWVLIIELSFVALFIYYFELFTWSEWGNSYLN
jgi:hypothetical protein